MQKYGTNPELDKLVDSDYWDIRITAAEQGYGLDILVKDEDRDVRRAVAEQGYGLDVLIKDENWYVREAVAMQGYGLDILINDEDSEVREAVAKQGYGLDILINDEVYDVRAAVAEHGYGLDMLINDENSVVRATVAMQGYCLDVLINDKDMGVRRAVADQGYSLDVLIKDENWRVRRAIAMQGYGLDKLIYDINWDVCAAVQQYLKEHNYKSISDWASKNPDRVHGDINLQLTNDLKDFIYKIDESSKLQIQSNCDNIDDFFTTNESDILVICTVDTKEPIIKIEKSISDQKSSYKFIIDITNENGEIFIIKTFIKFKEQLSERIEQLIDILNQCPEFSKYVADLENCL